MAFLVFLHYWFLGSPIQVRKKMCGLISIFLFCVTQRRYRSSIKLCGMCLRRMCVSLILGGMFWTVLLFMSSGSDIGLPIWKVYPLLRSHHWIFNLLNFPFRFISVYFTHWILWCWVHTELCLPIELTLPSFNTVFTSCEGFHTTICFVWCKCGHPSCVWLPLAWNKCLVLFLVCVVWDLQPVFVHSI